MAAFQNLPSTPDEMMGVFWQVVDDRVDRLLPVEHLIPGHRLVRRLVVGAGQMQSSRQLAELFVSSWRHVLGERFAGDPFEEHAPPSPGDTFG